MPTSTGDQQLTLPVLGDAADQSVSFGSYNTGAESRLVKRYTNEADRTARNAAPTAGEFSYLTSPGRWDRHVGGGVWWEAFPLWIRKAAETQVVNNSTVLVNDSHLILPVVTNARYALDGLIIYDSGTTGDIKVGWTVPAAATIPWWYLSGVDVAVTTGIGNLNALPSAAAGTTLARAGSGIGTFTAMILKGHVVTIGTAGNLTLQWAQNAAEAVNTRIKTDSWISLTRVG